MRNPEFTAVTVKQEKGDIEEIKVNIDVDKGSQDSKGVLESHVKTEIPHYGNDNNTTTQVTETEFRNQCSPKLFLLLHKSWEPTTQVQMIRTVIGSQYLPVVKDSRVVFDDSSSETSGNKNTDKEEVTIDHPTDASKPNTENNDVRRTNTLQFPPCAVCGGKASGMHYGVNSCEACKGFFRRYLNRSQEYKCTKGGKCKIINRNRGNCSGCRLQRCLELGMAKENSKLGRYTLARRTLTIQTVNKLERKTATATKPENSTVKEESDRIHSVQFQAKRFVCHPETEAKRIKLDPVFDTKGGLSDALVETLVHSMDEIRPYGPLITCESDVNRALEYHIQRYQKKVESFGEMKSIPKEEYYKLYQEFGVDIDNRMTFLRETAAYIENTIDNYCNFAKNIPNFSRLSFRDQCNLLKSSRCDFFIILMHEGCRSKVFLMHNGVGYHLEEIADKFFSRKLIMTVLDMYKRWQKLFLTRREKAILIALTIVFTDRCNLDDHASVEKIQLSLVDLLRRELDLTDKSTAQRRFLKIIDYLTLMRESSEMYLKEYKLLCKDDIVVEECPMITEFLLED